MAALEKIIWVANYSTLDEFMSRAVNCGATGFAIRTDNDLTDAIPAAHARGMQIYGWRWPAAMREDAMAEADAVASLFADKLDGYFLDTRRAPGVEHDWDQPGLEELAHEVCTRITAAAEGKPFGITSHYRAADAYPDIPWKTLFQYASVLVPQSYWRSSLGKIGSGQPAANYIAGIDAWTKAGCKQADIVPMAGELGASTPDEIRAYAAAAAARHITTLHYYCYDSNVPPAVWSAVAAS